ncbi:MAG TPA: malonate decarboxylase holo-[acyl-carrier-protein] synthase [Noviherbaspirillum sp.]|jgi:phosphoribosyl-dephospho-CoA transferase|uniref:malonate decarboxylase holo-[acyl-carrier-protein] synthase n=1 Tax=Noviherbaspirillum sp. TaxID=1926288 RepID=UPI002DDD01A4|nr:malonate decarboxylase holo-[acyl-carrier-protein] synthase [Noviherbaspirillum sp.]HEV2609734.1 malonate decarboxylase holo-[acyl-carrier-protein] synthase [Noviherbaspirillum sp.]
MLARHSLAWLTPEGWREAETACGAGCRDVIARWRQADWPAIVRRRDVDATDDQCAVGLALPPDPASGYKRRLALQATLAHVAKVLPPLAMEEAIPAAPASWRSPLAELELAAGEAGVALRVYGSLALQALTGQSYLTASSDIDVLCYPVTREQLTVMLGLLQATAAQVPLDGEIVFPSGQAVAWKEWLAADNGPTGVRVLVKDYRSVYLAKPSELRDTLETA